MQAHLGTIVYKFGGDPAIRLGEKAICANAYRRTDGRRTLHDGIKLIPFRNELQNDPLRFIADIFKLTVCYLDVRMCGVGAAELATTSLLLAMLVELGTSKNGDAASTERQGDGVVVLEALHVGRADGQHDRHRLVHLDRGAVSLTL